MSEETHKDLVRRLVDEAQSRGNLAIVDELLTDDFVDHTPFPGVPPTRDGVKMLFGYLRAAFPDLHVRIDEQVADSEKVVTRKTFAGTHRGEFMGAPPTGRPVSWEVIDILTFRDGRIAEHRVILDRLGIQEQIAG
jgi:steroid delta-isomerase-like uncharacterized protein